MDKVQEYRISGNNKRKNVATFVNFMARPE